MTRFVPLAAVLEATELALREVYRAVRKLLPFPYFLVGGTSL